MNFDFSNSFIIVKVECQLAIYVKKKVGFEFAVDDLKVIKIAVRLFTEFYNRKIFFKDYLMPECVLPSNLRAL